MAPDGADPGGELVEVSYDPRRGGSFYRKDSGAAVARAAFVRLVRGRVFAAGVAAPDAPDELDGLGDDEVRARLRAAEDAIDAAYWTFTRCARGRPPPRELYLRRNALRTELAARGASPGLCPMNAICR